MQPESAGVPEDPQPCFIKQNKTRTRPEISGSQLGLGTDEEQHILYGYSEKPCPRSVRDFSTPLWTLRLPSYENHLPAPASTGEGESGPFSHSEAPTTGGRTIGVVHGRCLGRAFRACEERQHVDAGVFCGPAPLTLLRSVYLRLRPCCAWATRPLLARGPPARLSGPGAGTDRLDLPPDFSASEVPGSGCGLPGTRPGATRGPSRSGLGWEAAGGAAWHVQSDGQLLQLV